MLEMLLAEFKKSSTDPRYVRLAFLAGTTYTTITEVEIRSTPGGTNLCRLPNVVATASSTYGNGYSPNGTIDGRLADALSDPGTNWCAAQTNPPSESKTCWLQIDLLQGYPIGSIRVATPAQYGRDPTRIEILISNDGTNWSSLALKQNLTWESLIFKELL